MSIFDISKVSLNEHGYVELGDDELIQLESSETLATAGAGNNWSCGGINSLCTNTYCGGSSNTSECKNSLSCGTSRNARCSTMEQ